MMMRLRIRMRMADEDFLVLRWSRMRMRMTSMWTWNTAVLHMCYHRQRSLPVRSGWRQGRVRRGRPLLSRPRGAVDSGLAAVLAAVESVAVFVRVCVVGFGWMVVRFVRVIRLPACARVSRVSRVCPGSPRCLFTDSSTRKSNHFSSFRPGKVGTQKQPCGGNHVTTTAPRTVDAGRGIGRRECDDSERDRRGRLDHERT